MAGGILRATGWGILLEKYADGFSVHHTVIESNALGALKSGVPGTISIDECYIEDNGRRGDEAIYITGPNEKYSSRFRLTGNTFHQVGVRKLTTDFVHASIVSGNRGLFEGADPILTTAHSEILFSQNREEPEDEVVATYLSKLNGQLSCLEGGQFWTNTHGES